MKPAIIIVALAAGCSIVDMHTPPPADWPALTIVEHRASFLDVQRACAPTMPLAVAAVSMFMGCSWIQFNRGECHVWLIDSQEGTATWEHETEHCRGRDHIGSSVLATGWQAYKSASSVQ